MTSFRLADRAAALGELPDGERDQALRDLLRTDVHDVVMRMTVDDEHLRAADLAELAAEIRRSVPEGAEDELSVRVRIFVALLRRDALDAAWTLAHDNASGVVRPARASSMWAGGSFLNTGLPLPTLIEDGHVYAWLPGFRDPRWGVPDEVYDIDRNVVLRQRLDEMIVDGGVLRMSGPGYLGLLRAEPDDVVTVEFRGPDGAQHVVRAARARRTDAVKRTGPDLTRLAWGGWYVRAPLHPLFAAPGTWRLRLGIEQQGVRRTAPLGRHRGPLAEPALVDSTRELKGHRVDVAADPDARLLLRVRKLGASARVMPRPARQALRRILPR